MAGDGWGEWAPYVTVAERRAQAAREVKKLQKGGAKVSPVVIDGRAIASTFWGKSWCKNLESYSDYANRMPRGRTYVRNGSVIDLQVQGGSVTARVSGSRIYRVEITVKPLPAARFHALAEDCSGAIDSVVELLAGKLSRGVMERLCRKDGGLFPTPKELSFSCSCPDWASMCKHVAAALYGVGARLDDRPELLFALREVDQAELVAKVSAEALLGGAGGGSGDVALGDAGLESLFGIEMEADGAVTWEGVGAGAAPAAESPPVAGVAVKVPAAKSQPVSVVGGESPDDLITAQDLLGEGIPRSTFQNWVSAGHLRRTETRGVYLVTEAGWERINRFVAAQGGGE